MYWQCDQPKELCLLPADPRLCFIENRLGRNARELIFFFFFIFGAFAAYLCLKWMLYYEILPFYFIFFSEMQSWNKSVNACLHT